MLIYPSVREFMKEREPGSVIVVPSQLLEHMSVYLDPRLLLLMEYEDNRIPKLSEAPFYVLRVEPFVTALEEERSGYRLDIKGEAEVPGTSIGRLSINFGLRQSTRMVRVQDQTMPGGTRIYDLENLLRRIRVAHGSAIDNKPVFLYVQTFTPKTIDILSRKQWVDDIPIYVMIPVKLDESIKTEIKVIKPIIEHGINLSFLLGLEPSSVYEEVSKDTRPREYPLPRYLIMKMFEGALPGSDMQWKHNTVTYVAHEVVDTIIDVEISEHNLPPEPELVLSVSTLFLDALRSASRKIGIFLREHPGATAEALTQYVCRDAMTLTETKKEILAFFAKRIGASKEVVDTIRKEGMIFHTTGYSNVRYAELRKWWSRIRTEAMMKNR